jgi:hypothetical protein
MNEIQAKRALVEALGGTGQINNDRQFWTTALTALNNGVFASANNEHQFWAKFAQLLPAWTGGLSPTQAIVSNGDVIAGTGGDFTVTVAGGVITGGTWEAE